MKRLTLGIDVGTSKIAAVVFDGGRKAVVEVSTRPVPSHRQCGGGGTKLREYDAEEIVSAVLGAVMSLSAQARASVGGVGVTGQMHGVVVVSGTGNAVSPFVSWQDQRCDDGFIDRLSSATGGHRLASGFGCATLAWWAERGQLPAESARCGTIASLVVSRLCSSTDISIDQCDAAAFGLYDHGERDWDRAAIEAAGIKKSLMPKVEPPGATFGTVSPSLGESVGIPAGVPVCVATGDFQAALLSVVDDPDGDVAINLGTSGQLAIVLPSSPSTPVPPRLCEKGASFELRPFFGDRLVLTAAALQGGSAWLWLVRLLRSWTSDLGCPIAANDDAIFSRLTELGLGAMEKLEPTSLRVTPRFSGERHDTNLRGAITGIDEANMHNLGGFSLSLARGVVRSLVEMMPNGSLSGRRRVVTTGNAIKKSELFKRVIEEEFGLPVVTANHPEEAAVGAATMAFLSLSAFKKVC